MAATRLPTALDEKIDDSDESAAAADFEDDVGETDIDDDEDLADELAETGLDVSEASPFDADHVIDDEESARVAQAPD